MSLLHKIGAPVALGEKRVLKPGRLRWLRALGWMVAMTLLVMLSFRPAMEIVYPLLPKDDMRFNFAANALFGVIALAAYALVVRFGEDRQADEVALKPAAGQLLVGLALGAGMFSAVMGVMVAFDLYTIDWKGAAPAWRGAGLAIQAALIEEIIIRGVMLRLLWRAFGPVVAFILSAAFFGGAHIVNPEATFFSTLCIAEVGLMLGALYALTGRLWVPIGVHAAWNFTQGYVFGAAVSGKDAGPALAQSTAHSDAATVLTGGAFGPEASLPVLIIVALVGLPALWLAWKDGRFSNQEGA